MSNIAHEDFHHDDFEFAHSADEKLIDKNYSATSYIKDVWNNFKKNKGALVGAIIIIFLIIMAIYFIFFDKKIKVKGGVISAVVCCGLAGFLAGLFGIGGPPAAIYFLAVTNDKSTYIANIQSVFVVGCISATITRFAAGIFTLDMVPLAIPGVMGVWCGKQIGTRILNRIDIAMVRKLVYFFLIFSGAVTFLTNR